MNIAQPLQKNFWTQIRKHQRIFFKYILLKKETQQELFFIYIMIKDFYYLSLFHQFHIITENVIVQRCSMSPHCLIISLGVLVTYICTIWFLFFSLYIFCEVG